MKLSNTAGVISGMPASDARRRFFGPGIFLFLLSCSGVQKPDLNFNATVANPAYSANGPKVLFDEAHNNAHKTTDRYKPLARLLASDGYRITAGKEKFSKEGLQGYDLLIIVLALSDDQHSDRPAFAPEECDAVENWAREGGGVLLITDHYPFGSTAAVLAQRFGVEIAKGYAEDSVQYDRTTDDASRVVFSRADGSLTEHAVTSGRDSTERVDRVETFTGTSLLAAASGAAFLKLSDRALDFFPSAKIEKSDGDTRTIVTYGNPVSASGRAQGLALQFGEGRVVILGDAGMLTAQVNRDGKPFGMNLPGNDNKQLALNIMHWLSGLLE